MAGGSAHWSRRHRSKSSDSLRPCKNRKCGAPNRPHRKKCWKCGEDVGAQPMKSSYWHEQRRRSEEAINVTHTKQPRGAIASIKDRSTASTFYAEVEQLA